MKFASALTVLIVEAAVIAAHTKTNTSSVRPSLTQSDPCAIVSSRAASNQSSASIATAEPLKPSEVYACLQSVPYDQDTDSEQTTWIQNILQFQSTTAYLKDPPSTYPLPAVDLFGGLNNISSFITDGKYTSEYEIELDLYNLINGANDGHLLYLPFLLGVVNYNRNFDLVSVSMDGAQSPKIYFLSDIRKMSNESFVPSAVTSINGQDIQYVSRFGRGMQDLDALYNSALYSPATAASPETSGGIAITAFTQQSDTSSCNFENGTSKVINATVGFDPVHAAVLTGSGEDIFDNISSPGSSASTSSSAATNTSTSPTTPTSSLPLGSNFPSPIVKNSQNYISGYFLNEAENRDVAVLNVASFNAMTPPAIKEFLQDSTSFLAKCKSAGKTRLIVDMRNNGGGSIQLGYNLFQQLFPNISPYSGIRMRDSKAANALGQIASNVSIPDAELQITSNFFNARYLLQKPDGPQFDNWQELDGPQAIHGDSFTNIASWPNSDKHYNAEQVTTTVGNETDLPVQVFPSESITILTDGQCSSTCTTFTNLMIRQGRVKTVTVGGRPNNQPMAVIGGTQGNEVLHVESLQEYAAEAIAIQVNATGNSSSEAAEARKQLLPLVSPPPITVYPGKFSVNLLDNIAQNDTTATPLQFTGGMPADCRFYYMPADIVSVANTWARVARGVKAGGSGLCINGTVAKWQTGGSNTSAPLTFQGGASIQGVAKSWIVLLVAFLSLATIWL